MVPTAMKRFLFILPLFCSLAFGQGLTMGKATTGKGTWGPGAASGGGPTTVTKIGSTSASFGTAYVTTVTGNAAIGGGIIIAFSVEGSPQPDGTASFTTAVVDSGSNSYTCDVQASQPTFSVGSVQICHAYVATGLTSGVSTITVTPSATGCAGISCDGNSAILIYYVSKMKSASPLDQAIGTASAGNSPATGSVTTVASPEIAFAAFVTQHTAWSAFGNILGTAATGLDSAFANGNAGRDLNTQWRELGTTGAGTATMTGNGGWDWANALATYKEM